MLDRIRNGVDKGELNDTELFLFTENWVSESVFYKGTSRSTLLIETVLKLHGIQMEGILILHVVPIAGTRMIEVGIDGLFRGNNLGGIIRGIYPLQFIPLNLEDLEKPK